VRGLAGQPLADEFQPIPLAQPAVSPVGHPQGHGLAAVEEAEPPRTQAGGLQPGSREILEADAVDALLVERDAKTGPGAAASRARGSGRQGGRSGDETKGQDSQSGSPRR
jgi:hypothetical protein